MASPPITLLGKRLDHWGNAGVIKQTLNAQRIVVDQSHHNVQITHFIQPKVSES